MRVTAFLHSQDPEETFTLSESGNVFPLDSTAAEGIVRQLLKINPLAGKGGRDPPTRHVPRRTLSRPRLDRAFHSVGHDRLGESFQALCRHGREEDGLVELGTERSGDEDVYLVKPRQGLNARGEIHRAAEKREFLPFAGTHEAREPQAAVDTDTNGKVWQAFAIELDIVDADRFAHGESGTDGVAASSDGLRNVKMLRLFSGEEVAAVRQKRAQIHGSFKQPGQ